MRVLLLEGDEDRLAERRRLGLDGRDEQWEGVLHVVPQPSERHQRLEAKLVMALGPDLERRGYRIAPELAMYGAADDYRVPDVTVYRPDVVSGGGVDGAPELVIEIRSPGDESDAKVPWYLGRGAGAVVVIDRDTLAVEAYTAAGRVAPDDDSLVTIAHLGVRIGSSGPDRLLVETSAGPVEVDL